MVTFTEEIENFTLFAVLDVEHLIVNPHFVPDNCHISKAIDEHHSCIFVGDVNIVSSVTTSVKFYLIDRSSGNQEILILAKPGVILCKTWIIVSTHDVKNTC